MNTKHPGMRGAPAAAQRRWNSLGVSPANSRNRLLNEPRLLRPTAWHTSVTVRLVARRRSWARAVYAVGQQVTSTGGVPVLTIKLGGRKPVGATIRC